MSGKAPGTSQASIRPRVETNADMDCKGLQGDGRATLRNAAETEDETR
jgi:hypothetical protein